MSWLDVIQKWLPIVVGSLKLYEYYPKCKQWLQDSNQQSFWKGIHKLLRGLALLETVLLVVLLGLAIASFWARNYSPAMPATAFLHMCKYTLGGAALAALGIKGFWHYAIKLADL